MTRAPILSAVAAALLLGLAAVGPLAAEDAATPAPSATPAPAKCEFDNSCAMGLAEGQTVKTDCSENWAAPNGKVYCFSSENSKATFLKNMAIRLLLGTVSILVSQLVLVAALGGIGILVRRGFGLRALRLDDFFLSFWLGLASVTLFLLLWNFLFPVNALAMTLVLSVGLLALLSNRHEVSRILEGEDWRPGLLTWLLLAMLGLWLANLAIAPLESYDSALYHLQAVRWAERFPAIPGIGNLYGPLALNNAYLLFDAMLSTGFWEGRANHIANGLLVLVFLAQCVIAGARIAGGTRDPRRVFEFLLLAAGVRLALNGHVSSFTTDLAPSLVLLVVAVQLYTMWSVEDESYAPHSYRFFAIGMLLAAAVSFKTNAALFAATSFPLAILLWARKHKATMSVVKTSRMAVAAVGVFAAVVMARGLVLSGYPFFPASFGGFPVEWRVPAEHADAELAYIVHSARASSQNFPVVAGEAGFSAWFPHWSRRVLDNPYNIAVPFGVTMLAATALLAKRGSARSSSSGHNAGWWLLLPILVSVVAWFGTAPEPRYAVPYFWALASLCVAEAFRRRPDSAKSDTTSLMLAGALLGVSPALVNPVIAPEFSTRSEHPLKAIFIANVNRPGDDQWFRPIEGKPKITPYRTRSGLLLNTVPALCWDAPLPCTPNPAPNLRLRDSTNLSRGFMVDGAWQMENWPMDWQPRFLETWRKSRSRGSE